MNTPKKSGCFSWNRQNTYFPRFVYLKNEMCLHSHLPGSTRETGTKHDKACWKHSIRGKTSSLQPQQENGALGRKQLSLWIEKRRKLAMVCLKLLVPWDAQQWDVGIFPGQWNRSREGCTLPGWYLKDVIILKIYRRIKFWSWCKERGCEADGGLQTATFRSSGLVSER